jgi:hypothetical protein
MAFIGLAICLLIRGDRDRGKREKNFLGIKPKYKKIEN